MGIISAPERDYMKQQRSAWGDYLAATPGVADEWNRLGQLMLELQKGGQGGGQRFKQIAEQRMALQRNWREPYRQQNPLSAPSPWAPKPTTAGAPSGSAPPPVLSPGTPQSPADAWKAAVPAAPAAPQRTYGWLSRRFNQ